ncbi:MAG: phage portal protein, partial [Boseongicola sp.]|nr:phage portal protein [Boseongicola sp.]
IRMGVEQNAVGAPVAYHFLTSHPGDNVWLSGLTRKKYRRVPASNIIHFYERLRPGQSRGEPPAASVINSIKMLDGYREAEVVNRRIAASTMGFFENDMPSSEGLQPLSDVSGDEGRGEELFFDLEPGTFKDLPAGKRFSKFDPGGSVTDYADFESQIKKDVSTGLGISVVALGMEYQDLSFSTHRGVIQEDRDHYKAFQGFLIDAVMDEVFMRWLPLNAVFSDVVPPTRIDAILSSFVFRPRGWEWVDPSKDIKAEIAAIEANVTSYSRSAARRGIDRDELFAEIASDKKALESYGLTAGGENDNSSASKGSGNA